MLKKGKVKYLKNEFLNIYNDFDETYYNGKKYLLNQPVALKMIVIH